MSGSLTGCRVCGSTTFDVFQSYALSGELVADHPGVIKVVRQIDDVVDQVACTRCGTEPNDYEIQFC